MRAALLVALLTMLAAAPKAHAVGACDTIKRAKPAKRGSGIHRPPLVLGDSSMLLGVGALAKLGFEADARGCRQMGPSLDIFAQRKRAGTLPRLVVLAIGNNGPISQSQIDRALRIVGKRRMLGLVTPAVQPGNTMLFRRNAARHPRRIVLIDWKATNPYRYGSDGIHIGTAGEAAEARLIYARTRPYFPPPKRLQVPASARDARDCGVVHRGREALRVFVVEGDTVLCKRAREIVRTRSTRRVPGWRYFAWSLTGGGAFTDVWARQDLKIVVAARPPVGT